MPLIDSSYFYGPIAVAQITQPEVLLELNLYIAKYEPQVLTCLLGAALYAELLDAIAGDANLVAGGNAKYKAIRDGVLVYTDLYGQRNSWIGLTNASKSSPIANFVYFYYSRDHVTATTGTGEKVGDAENSTSVSSVNKQVHAWNELVDYCRALRLYILSNQANYPTWVDPWNNERRVIYPYTNDKKCWQLFKTINSLNI